MFILPQIFPHFFKILWVCSYFIQNQRIYSSAFCYIVHLLWQRNVLDCSRDDRLGKFRKKFEIIYFESHPDIIRLAKAFSKTNVKYKHVQVKKQKWINKNLYHTKTKLANMNQRIATPFTVRDPKFSFSNPRKGFPCLCAWPRNLNIYYFNACVRDVCESGCLLGVILAGS